MRCRRFGVEGIGLHRSCTKVVMMDIVGIVVSFHHPSWAAEGHRSCFLFHGLERFQSWGGGCSFRALFLKLGVLRFTVVQAWRGRVM